jgi:hypothetical protein
MVCCNSYVTFIVEPQPSGRNLILLNLLFAVIRYRFTMSLLEERGLNVVVLPPNRRGRNSYIVPQNEFLPNGTSLIQAIKIRHQQAVLLLHQGLQS